jgi:hypothetical protein
MGTDGGADPDGGSSGGDAAASGDGGTGTVGTGNPGGRCKAGDTPEGEPNNNPGQATPIAKGFCGELADAQDVDYAVLKLPASATGLDWDLESTANGIEYWVTVGATRVKLTDSGVPFEPGADYVVEVRNTTAKKIGYRVTFAVK